MTLRFLKKIVNFFLALFDLRIVKIPLSEKMLNILLKEKNIKFLQIGGNDGISFDCLYDYVTKYKWQGIVVEPLDEFYKLLCDNYKGYPNIRPVKYAINSSQKEMDLYKLNPNCYNFYPEWAKGVASFSKDHLIKHNIERKHILTEKVKCISLMDLIIKFKFEDIVYLQVDTEGFDAEVIKMIDFSIVKPKLIKYEIKHIEEKQKNEVSNILLENGYKLKYDHSDCFAIKKF
jgi:FkbM family methyltransferase